MKPKEYLKELDELALKSCSTDKEYYLGMKAGAQKMYDLIRGAQHRYLDANREKIRAYNTQYQRERRARIKGMKEDIDKISMMN